MFKIIYFEKYFVRVPLYLLKLPVMFLNEGLILHPDFHPESLVLTELNKSLGGGVGGVTLTVLLLPGLNTSSEATALISIGSQISPPTPLTGPGKVTKPGMSAYRTIETG